MNDPDQSLTAEILCRAPDGIAVVEADSATPHLLYANATLATLLGREEVTLSGCALADIEAAVSAESAVANLPLRVHLRRADGSTVDCERFARLLPQSRLALFYRPVAASGAVVAAGAADRPGTLATPEHLMEVLRRDWSSAQRDGRVLGLMRFEVDGCRDYLEVFGRGATDNALRQVGRILAAAMRRSSDVVARSGDGEFLALGVSMEAERTVLHAGLIVRRVRDLAILHPRSRTGRYLTVSAGVVIAVPPQGAGCEVMLEAARQALAAAQEQGGNRVVAGTLPDSQTG
jgi:diguanylate cyclase (GGDEF)-like protein